MGCSCHATKKTVPVKQVTKNRIASNRIKNSVTSNGTKKVIRRVISH